MTTLPNASLSLDPPLAGRRLLAYLLPFLFALIIPLGQWFSQNVFLIPILGLLAIVVVLALVGLFKNLPLWSLPNFGLALGLANLLFFTSLVYGITGLSYLKFTLWTDFIPGRVLYAAITAVLTLAPNFLLLVGLGLLSTSLPALAAFRRRLGQDWTLLPFVLLITSLLNPLRQDAYHGLQGYTLLYSLVLTGAAWLYLRSPRPWPRMAILLSAALLSGLALALGIYQIYPLQSWANDARQDFPRWWEALMPLLDALAMLIWLALVAAFGATLRRAERPDAPGSLTKA